MAGLPYREMIAWQKGYALALAVVRIAQGWQEPRLWAFRDQVIRSAMSVPANIAEGHGRGTQIDFAGFLDRARGSLFELDTWLLAARDLGQLGDNEHTRFAADIAEVNAILFSLRATLHRKAKTEPRR